MATQAEINQLLGTWVANYRAIFNLLKGQDGTKELTTWFSTYISPLSVESGTATIRLLTRSQWDNRNRGNKNATARGYLEYLKSQLQSITPQLESSLATLGVKNYITLVATYKKLVSRIQIRTK